MMSLRLCGVNPIVWFRSSPCVGRLPYGSSRQPKLGKVSNAVKAELEEALRSAKTALEKATVEKQIEDEKLDVTLPG